MGQGACVIGIGVVAFTMEGATAGWSILGLLALFSVCRAVCSTSYKDVLGKTVKKTTRGAAMGIASSTAAIAVLAFGALLATGIIPRDVTAIAIVIMCAGIVWFAAGMLFFRVEEKESDIDEDADLFSLKALAAPLHDDTQLRIFITARALLVPTALAPPFLIAMAATGQGDAGALGPFILASALASILSGYIWGRLSDRSSRWTFIIAGGLAAAVLAVAAFIAAGSPSMWVVVGLLFVAQIGYEGVRSARKVHLVDMADEDRRAVYTALSNTIIGVVLIAGGVLGVISQVVGLWAALATSAALIAAGVAVAFRLDEVQGERA
jgi:predicted MFS family arabinose efflux permease